MSAYTTHNKEESATLTEDAYFIVIKNEHNEHRSEIDKSTFLKLCGIYNIMPGYQDNVIVLRGSMKDAY